MISLGSPYSADELATVFEEIGDYIENRYASLSTETFFSTPSGGWSIDETIRHLIQTTKPIVFALSLPRLALLVLFGQNKKAVKRMELIEEPYNKALHQGLKAGRFSPSKIQTSSKTQMTDTLSKATTVFAKMASVTRATSERDLDRYRLPHPVFGKIPLREMLLLSMLHAVHHLRKINDKVST